MSVRARLETIHEKIQQAARRAGRNPAEVTLVLVTKAVPVPRIQEAYEAGARDFGENRVQEWLEKVEARHASPLPSDIRWHFVGHLQTNKVKTILQTGGARFPRPQGGETPPLLLHSLDRLSLAETIQKEAGKQNLTMDALIQVNTSGEATKSGFSADEVEAAIEKIRTLDRVRLRGLMTIGPLADDEKKIRESFRTLRALRDRLRMTSPDLPHLSMGMSRDFEIAIEEGATMVRIGSAVFGEREPHAN